jgi:alkylation response protein AidB-like acyl-CoA dehydrogenase
MDFSNTPEEEQFRKEVRAFAEANWGPAHAATGREHRGDDPARIDAFTKKIAEKGWYALGWPAEYGGIPTSTMQKYILSQEMNRVGAPLLLYNVNVLGPLLIKHATPETRDDLLPRIKAGTLEFQLGFTEPETGSDLANLATKAVREGDDYVVNGQKLYGHPTPDDIMFLAVRTDPDAPVRKGITILLVDANSEGLTITHNRTLAGGYVGATYYDNVRVPKERLLGEENKGWELVRESLDLDRLAGIPYDHHPVLFNELVAYINAHTDDAGTPLAELPWVRERIAQLAIELEGSQLLRDMMASKVADGDELHADSSVVKTFCTEFETRLVGFGMELLSNVSQFTTAAGVDELAGNLNYLFRSNVAQTIVGGSNEIQRNIIALQGLGLPRG